MALRHLVCWFLVAALTTVHAADEVGYQELVAKLDMLQGQMSALEFKDSAQQQLISEQETTIKRMESVLNAVVTRHRNGGRILDQRLHDVEETLAGRTNEHVKRQVVDPTIAFMARMNSSRDEIGIDQNLIFDQVLMNIGNGYHDRQGVFLAPEAGIYIFSATLVYTKVTEQMDAAIVHNGKTVCKIYAAASVGWEPGSQTALIQVGQGDEVYVQNIDRSGISVHGGGYSTFCGYLLYYMP